MTDINDITQIIVEKKDGSSSVYHNYTSFMQGMTAEGNVVPKVKPEVHPQAPLSGTAPHLGNVVRNMGPLTTNAQYHAAPKAEEDSESGETEASSEDELGKSA